MSENGSHPRILWEDEIVRIGDVLHTGTHFCNWFKETSMENPRAMGLPALVLGILMLGSSVSTLLGTSYVWTSLSGLSNIAGGISGFASLLIGVAILQQWGEFAID